MKRVITSRPVLGKTERYVQMIQTTDCISLQKLQAIFHSDNSMIKIALLLVMAIAEDLLFYKIVQWKPKYSCDMTG